MNTQMMTTKYNLPPEVLDLLIAMYPDEENQLQQANALSSIISVSKNWIIPRDQRLHSNLYDSYAPYANKIMKVVDALGLRQTKRPSYQQYDSIILLGSTGLSHYQIWKNIISFHQNTGIQFNKIFLLGGDRSIHPIFDSLKIAYKYHGEDFKYQIKDSEIAQCANEMALMELLWPSLKLPESLTHIPVIPVFSPKPIGEAQSNTEDTLLQFKKENSIHSELPLLVMSTLPYLVRQGLQARMVLSNHPVDTAATFQPYLETLETPLKGALPLALYLDELHWLFCSMDKLQQQTH